MMKKVTQQAALDYHAAGLPGKIEVVPTKPSATQYDLSLAYSPGVAEPCMAIKKDAAEAYRYTAKGNLVAVVSNGTAVLGLGNIGALASKPVMEGKAVLFKIYAGIDVFDLEVEESDPERFVAAVKAVAPTFGGINLEDIKSPECFEIERRLSRELQIPVVHDDQHGTAIVTSAALLNAAELAGKRIDQLRVVINGAGASAIATARLFVQLGVQRERVSMFDSKGLLCRERDDLSDEKREFACPCHPADTLADALRGADLFLGLSRGNVLSRQMVASMAPSPIIFALANPTPEIGYDEAMSVRGDLLMGTGRSDYPNQINNVLCFPYLFRGALDCCARRIDDAMKLAAVRALAALARKPVPPSVRRAYGGSDLSFGPRYFIPTPFDPRLITSVAVAVAQAAAESGAARAPIAHLGEYRQELRRMMERVSAISECVTGSRQ